MRGRYLTAIGLIASIFGLSVACNFIVASDYRDFGTSCQFEGRETTCGQCISKNCQAKVDAVCSGADSKQIVYDISSCSQNNDVSSGDSCRPFHFDGGVIAANDDSAKDRNLRVCVRDNCLENSDTPPCKSCELKYTDPPSGQAFKLTDSQCGKCIQESCAPELISCCSFTVVQDNVRKCAFADREMLASCAELMTVKDAGAGSDKCYTSVPNCVRTNCRTECAAP